MRTELRDLKNLVTAGPGVPFEGNSYIRGNKLVVVWGEMSLVNLTIPHTLYILVSGSHDATQCAQDSIPTRALCLRKIITVNTSSSGCVFMFCEKSPCMCVCMRTKSYTSAYPLI